jgi:ABC-type multidrug transport system fused ATPase/permease subunit
MLKNTVQKTSSSSSIHILIFILSIVVSVAFLIIFWRMLLIFIEDRERPINLFLTIKKKIFEDLKNSAEGFSNKLLNKVFGNEDNDEESQQDYQANIKANDINIIKFKTKNDYRTSVNKDKTHFINYMKLVIFFLVFLIYMSFKFGYFMLNIESMSRFIEVYNITQKLPN